MYTKTYNNKFQNVYGYQKRSILYARACFNTNLQFLFYFAVKRKRKSEERNTNEMRDDRNHEFEIF